MCYLLVNQTELVEARILHDASSMTGHILVCTGDYDLFEFICTLRYFHLTYLSSQDSFSYKRSNSTSSISFARPTFDRRVRVSIPVSGNLFCNRRSHSKAKSYQGRCVGLRKSCYHQHNEQKY